MVSVVGINQLAKLSPALGSDITGIAGPKDDEEEGIPEVLKPLLELPELLYPEDISVVLVKMYSQLDQVHISTKMM